MSNTTEVCLTCGETLNCLMGARNVFACRKCKKFFEYEQKLIEI
jgi:tRNA(Ile2) C34 agmatinyltransferase TiaS